MRQLTADEAQVLVEARRLLKALADAAHEAAYDEPAAGWGERPKAWELGMISARCERAEEAVFDAVNGLSAYGHDSEARATLHPSLAPVAVGGE